MKYISLFFSLFLLFSCQNDVKKASDDSTKSEKDKIHQEITDDKSLKTTGAITDSNIIEDEASIEHKEDVSIDEIEDKKNTENTLTEVSPPSKTLTVKNPIKKEPISKEPIKLPVGQLNFTNPVHNFGRLTEGDTVFHSFSFTNIGTGPIIIKDVLTTCGCTVPNFTKRPIMPGKTGEVDISFDSKGKLGSQNKQLTVLTNGKPSEYTLNIKALIGTD